MNGSFLKYSIYFVLSILLKISGYGGLSYRAESNELTLVIQQTGNDSVVAYLDAAANKKIPAGILSEREVSRR